MGLNRWSNGRVIRVPIKDFFFNQRAVQWKGKKVMVEYDLLTLAIKQAIAKGETKEHFLDEMFDMLQYGENTETVR